MKNAIGFVLIDAPHSALNNAGIEASAKAENKTVVKQIKRGRDSFPYVSAQAWRRWWRDALEIRCGWVMSPLQRGKGDIAFTKANPFSYPDDDVFGYMRAQGSAEGGTMTRLSPLKTSPLVSILPQNATDDFGVMSRQPGNPVLHEHQFYSTILKGVFALDLDAVGTFQRGDRTGFRNLADAYIKKADMSKTIEESGATGSETEFVLPSNVRFKRAKDVFDSLPFLSGGAKQALHHTDVTPKFVVLAVIQGGNNLWMSIAAPDDKKPVNIKALEQVIRDYADIIEGAVFIGRQEGFADALAPDLVALQTNLAGVVPVQLFSPRAALQEFAKTLEPQFAV